MNLRNLLTIILAFVALTAGSVVAPAPSEASHGSDHYVYARITARLSANGQVEFALQQRLSGNSWGDRIFPRARYFPTSTATVDQWLVSSTLTLPSLDDPSSEADVRITARLRDNGQVEFALQQLVDATWDAHIFPRARYFPTNATVGQWLVSSPLSATLPRSAADADRAVLDAFYHATGGQQWSIQTNWLSSRPLDRWHGVHTDSDGRVVELRFYNNLLTGSIPAEIGDLSNLERLRIRDNDNLSGPIPHTLGHLSNLREMALGNNNLSGSIPPELGNLSNLREMALGNNNLSGSIPPELGNLSNLDALYLDNNNLSGPIPPELGNLPNLDALHLYNNNLSGPIPSELGDI